MIFIFFVCSWFFIICRCVYGILFRLENLKIYEKNKKIYVYGNVY